MKIISNILEDIEGIQIYYIIGLLIFVIFFITVLIKTYILTSNEEIEEIKNSIIEDDNVITESENLKL